MPGLQPGVIGAEDLALLVEAFASTFLPNIIAKFDKSATLSTDISGGNITGITIIDGGWGYASAPTLTITGDNGSSATATCTIDATTGVVETVTITNAGSGYTTAYTSAAANPDASTIKTILLSGLADKTYASAPTLIFEDPTSVDSDGVPLGTNVTATATIQLDAEGEISGFEIQENGYGYVKDPKIRISSPTESENRGKDVKEILIIALNHVSQEVGSWASGFKTLNENNYFNRKEDAYYAKKKWRDNYPISFFSSNIIKNTYTTSINSTNVKTNINQE
jgi:hypothetical protein